MERTAILPRGDFFFRGAGRRQSFFVQHGDERVHLRIQRIDTVEIRLGDLNGRDLTRLDQRCQFLSGFEYKLRVRHSALYFEVRAGEVRVGVESAGAACRVAMKMGAGSTRSSTSKSRTI